MIATCFLREPKSPNKTLIYVSVNHRNKRYKVSTQLRVKPKYWRPKNHLCSEMMEFPEGKEINKQLTEMKGIALKIVQDQPNIGPEKFRTQFRKELQEKGSTIAKTKFWKHFDDFVRYKKDYVHQDVYKDYHNSLRKHLKNCEARWGKELKIEDLKNSSGGFVDILDRYLTKEAINAKGERGLALNTVGKQYKNLKVFLNWCFDKDIVARFSLKHLVTHSEHVFHVYLDKDELDKIENLVLDDPLERDARDLFLIGCATGMRFSELNRIEPHQYNGKTLTFFRSKGGQKSIIPVSKGNRLSRILGRIIKDLPRFNSTAQFNPLVRRVCKKAGIDNIIEVPSKAQNKVLCEKIEKYKLIASHTARRSFCTNLYHKGMPAQSIMKLSGYKTESAFLRYLKLDAETVAATSVEFFMD
jgi:integrase